MVYIEILFLAPAMIIAHFSGFLCPLNANTYGLEFLEFEIKDYDTNKSVFKVMDGVLLVGHMPPCP